MLDRRVFVATFVLVVATLGTWAGAHFVRPLPEARWTTSDLPALPAKHDNAWALLEARVTVPDMDRLIVDDDEHDLDRIFDEASLRSDELRRELAPSEELRANIRQRPRFVEAGGMLGQSHVMQALATWELRSLSVLLATVEGEHDDAAEEIASMWTQAMDYTSHCQSMVSCLAGQRLLHLTLGSAEVLAARSHRDLRWLARLIESSPIDRTAITNGIVAEYVYARISLDTYETPPLLDRAHTDAMLVKLFDGAIELARDPSAPPPQLDFTNRPLWWAYNPMGKRFASTVTVEHLPGLVLRYGREADAIALRRDQVVESLARRAAYRTALQLAGEDPRTMTALHPAELGGGCEGE